MKQEDWKGYEAKARWGGGGGIAEGGGAGSSFRGSRISFSRIFGCKELSFITAYFTEIPLKSFVSL